MKIRDRLLPIALGGFFLFAVGLFLMPLVKSNSGAKPTVNVKVPELSAAATVGEAAFNANCAACHGKNAAGTKKGPPLVHDIYNPGHHADEAFFRAAKQGVPQHHWPFGNMPKRPGVTDEQITSIVRYIREMQQANGIFFRPHNM